MNEMDTIIAHLRESCNTVSDLCYALMRYEHDYRKALGNKRNCDEPSLRHFGYVQRGLNQAHDELIYLMTNLRERTSVNEVNEILEVSSKD